MGEQMNGGQKMWHVHDTMAGGKKSFLKKRINVSCDGVVVPFVSEVTYNPMKPKDDARTHHFGTAMLRGILMVFLKSGGWLEW